MMGKLQRALIIFLIGDIAVDEFLIPELEKRSSNQILERNTIFRKLLQVVIIVSEAIQFDILELFLFASKKIGNFLLIACLAFILAISTVIIGYCESRKAIKKYGREVGRGKFTREEKRNIAKFGSTDFSSLNGVYDYSKSFMVYAGVCNVLGYLTLMSLMWFLSRQSEFISFISKLNQNIFSELLSLISPVMIYLSILHIYGIAKENEGYSLRDYQMNPNLENPLNYSFKNIHVHANLLHFWFTLTSISYYIFLYINFTLVKFQLYKIDLFIILPLFLAVLFVSYSSSSGYAKKIGVIGQSIFLPSVVGLGIGIFILLGLHRWSSESYILSLIFLIYVGITSFLLKKNGSPTIKGAFPIAVIWILVVLTSFLIRLDKITF